MTERIDYDDDPAGTKAEEAILALGVWLEEQK